MTTPKRPGTQIWQIYPPQVLTSSGQEWLSADLPPTIEHRCLAYCYTKPGKSTPDLLADLSPTIKHRCLAYCYTNPGRSTPRSAGRSTPQASIDALHTVTENLADLPQICWQI